MIFQVAMINLMSDLKLKQTATMYQFQVNTFSDYSTNKNGFHAYIISINQHNYLNLIQEIIIDHPNAVCVVIINDYTEAYNLLHERCLFFVYQKTDAFYHQFWKFVLELVSAKAGIKTENIIHIADGQFDLHRGTFTKNDLEHTLSSKQLAVFKLLLKFRGEVVSRITLLDTIWNSPKIVTDRVLDTTIVALRKILSDNARKPKYLQTISGYGYKLNH